MSQPLRTQYQGRTIEITCPFRPGSFPRQIFASVIATYLDRDKALFFLYPGKDPFPKRGGDGPARFFWHGYHNEGRLFDYIGTNAHPVYMAGLQMRRWLDKNNIVEFQLQVVSDISTSTVSHVKEA